MNPFQKLSPLPANAIGGRGYGDAASAKAAALAAGHKSYAVLSAPRVGQLGPIKLNFGEEFAWVAPLETYTRRAAAALGAGIKLIEAVK